MPRLQRVTTVRPGRPAARWTAPGPLAFVDSVAAGAMLTVAESLLTMATTPPRHSASAAAPSRNEAPMTAHDFDHLVTALARRRPRRSALGFLSGLGLTGLAVRDVAAACRATGRRCGGGREPCCSGVCKGPRDKKTCRCPVRSCCECSRGGVALACSFAATFAECRDRCVASFGDSVTTSRFPAISGFTHHLRDNECSSASCNP